MPVVAGRLVYFTDEECQKEIASKIAIFFGRQIVLL